MHAAQCAVAKVIALALAVGSAQAAAVDQARSRGARAEVAHLARQVSPALQATALDSEAALARARSTGELPDPVLQLELETSSASAVRSCPS